MPMLGLTRREMDSVPAADTERGRLKERKDRINERTGSSARSMRAERRRQELKNKIVIMGDPSAVGVPF